MKILVFQIITFLIVVINYANGQLFRTTNVQQQYAAEPLPEVSFVYPEHDVHEMLEDSKKNANNRLPLYSPGRCRENELLYPGDQQDDWVCDCAPGDLFHPDTDKCYSMFTRGPCRDREYLVLPQQKNIPECVENPCQANNRVPFRGRCHTLNTAGPCRYPKLSYVVGVNVTTLQLDCIKQSSNLPTINVQDRFKPDEDEIKPLPPVIPVCSDGSKRVIHNLCQPSAETYIVESSVQQSEHNGQEQ